MSKEKSSRLEVVVPSKTLHTSENDAFRIRFKPKRGLLLRPRTRMNRAVPAMSYGENYRPRIFEASAPVVFINDEHIWDVELDYSDYESTTPDGRLRFGTTCDGRHVIQQIGYHGAGAASVEMLKMDCGRELDPLHLLLPHAGSSAMRGLALEQAGLRVFHLSLNWQKGKKGCVTCPVRNLEKLVRRRGSAIVSFLSSKLGTHVIIIDQINCTEGTALVRDPFHGWSIRVAVEALQESLYAPLDIMQVSS